MHANGWSGELLAALMQVGQLHERLDVSPSLIGYVGDCHMCLCVVTQAELPLMQG